jgi:hypothetical protein
MPSTSVKQAKFMRAIAHSPSFAKKVGVKQSVGKDFEMADKKMKRFDTGGSTMESKRKSGDTRRDTLGSDKDIVDRGNRTPYEPIPPKKESPKPKPKLGPMGQKGYAKGGVIKRMPTSEQMGDLNMAKGGGIEKKGKTGTKMAKMASGGSIDGVAQRGKTRCKGMK